MAPTRKAGIGSNQYQTRPGRLRDKVRKAVGKLAPGQMAQDQDNPMWAMRMFSGHINPGVRVLAAANPGVPLDIMNALAEDPDPKVRIGLLANPACPDVIISKLARDQDSQVRVAVAESSKASMALLRELAEDYDVTVAISAINNPNYRIIRNK